MSCILVTASLPMMVRNLVRTNLLAEINSRVPLIFVCPFAENTSILNDLNDMGIPIEKMPYDRRTLSLIGQFLWLSASKKRFLDGGLVDTTYFYERLTKNGSLVRHYAGAVSRLLNINGATERLGKRIWELAWATDNNCSQLIDKYKPMAVWSTHPFLESEWPILWHSEKRGIPLLASIHSWDNITTRGPLFFQFDRILVWSELMKKELLKTQPTTKPESIIPVGSPQHDTFLDETQFMSREAFFKENGLDPDRPLILFAGGGRSYPDEPELLASVVQSLENSDFINSPQLWIRFYGDDAHMKSLPKVTGRKGVFWEKATPEFWGAFRIEKTWSSSKGFEHYLNLLKYCDVVVCFASTVTLDAAIMDRPVINICYDVNHRLDFWDSVRRKYFDRDHYQRVISSGGVRLAFDHHELVHIINEYLDDSSKDRVARKRLVQLICGEVDGNARSRIVSSIVDFALNSRSKTSLC